MTENFPQFISDTKVQIQKAQRTLKLDKSTQNAHLHISFSNYRKLRLKKKTPYR